MRLTLAIFPAALLAGVLLAMPAVPQTSAVPDLLKRALSPPASSQLFVYDFEDVIEGQDGKRTVRGQVDPTRKRGDRVTITYLEDLRKKPADLKRTDARYEKNADGDIFCDTRSSDDVTNVSDKGEAPGGGRVFRFIPKPEPNAETMIRELSSKMSAEAVVDEISGLLRSFTATLTGAHRVNLFGEVKSATFSAKCAPLPNGRAYTARTDLKALISAMGKTYTQRTVQLISNVRPAG